MPTILLGFLLSWTWSISSRLLQQSAAVAPYLDEGYLLTAAIPDLERGIAPLGPPVPVQPLLLGLLLQSLTLASGLGWLLRVTTPGLGREVASPGCP